MKYKFLVQNLFCRFALGVQNLFCRFALGVQNLFCRFALGVQNLFCSGEFKYKCTLFNRERLCKINFALQTVFAK